MSDGTENRFVYADPEKCLGCKSCEIACGLRHAKTDLITAVLAGYKVRPRNRVVQSGGIRIPIQCRQCEDAPCAQVCPTGAIRQKDGMVSLERALCIGCKSCAMVCPFGAIRVRAEGADAGDDRTKRAVALKCDLCAEDQTGEISEEACACITACPTKAISLLSLQEYRMKFLHERADEIAAAVSGQKSV